MANITIADALYYYVPDYATVRIDGYNNNNYLITMLFIRQLYRIKNYNVN